ncbi:MAG: hypothetical protein LOD91_10650 [Limnochordales bacterium]|nr:hypothetical protein [Limnochordales bacterium]
MTDAVDCEAIRLSVITIEFRLSPTVRRLARSFARLTGIPLARLLVPDGDGGGGVP